MDRDDAKLLEQYKSIYDQKCDICLKIQPILANDLENILKYHSVKHIPITARIKLWDRAAETTKRRQGERLRTQELRKKSEDPSWTGLSWESYCRKWELNREDSEPFTSGQEVDKAIHDLLGARIALYFPSDVNKVRKILRESGYRDLKVKRKGGMNDLQRLRKLSDKLDKDLGAPSNADGYEDEFEEVKNFEHAFSGYGAIHLIAKIPRRLEWRIGLPAAEWEDFVVEIQVGTVVMNAWAEVEHDIIYKELDQVESFEDVQRISDLINGVALTGEVALKQLEAAIGTKREPRAAETIYKHAQDYNQFGEWIDQYLAGENLSTEMLPVRSDWKGLLELFEVWTGYNRCVVYPFIKLVKLTNNFRKADFDKLLPLRILQRFSEDLVALEPPDDSEAEQARFLAFQAVRTCQLATYFRCAGDVMTAYPKTPRITYFLDILHPKRPRYTGYRGPYGEHSMVGLVIGKSTAIVVKEGDKGEKDIRIQLSIWLAKCGFAAWPSPSKDQPRDKSSFAKIFTIPQNLWKLCTEGSRHYNVLPYILFDLFPSELHMEDCKQKARDALRSKRGSNEFEFFNSRSSRPQTLQPLCDESGRWSYSYDSPKWIIGHRNEFEQDFSLLPVLETETGTKEELAKAHTYIREIVKTTVKELKSPVSAADYVLNDYDEEETDRVIRRSWLDEAIRLRCRLDPELPDKQEYQLWQYCLQQNLIPPDFVYPLFIY